MTSNKKDPVLVVLQMTGAYDALNTFIPYSDPHYVDYRPTLQVGPDQVLAVDDKFGFHPGMGPIKEMYDQGKVAVLQGIGYPNPIRSPLPLPGHLAYRRARQDDHRGVAGQGHPGLGPLQREHFDRRKLWPGPPPSSGRARRFGSLGRGPGKLWSVNGNPGQRANGVRPWISSPACTLP